MTDTYIHYRVILCPLCKCDRLYTLPADGGSQCCTNCKLVFHECKHTREIKYGSPGPAACADCCQGSSPHLLQSVSSK